MTVDVMKLYVPLLAVKVDLLERSADWQDDVGVLLNATPPRRALHKELHVWRLVAGYGEICIHSSRKMAVFVGEHTSGPSSILFGGTVCVWNASAAFERGLLQSKSLVRSS